MVRKIALEEHFLCPGFEDYWKTTVGDVDPSDHRQVVARLSDFGEQRLESMDRRRHRARRAVARRPRRADRARHRDRAAARRKRSATISWPAKSRSGRTAIPASAHLPMQDPEGAADELERCMRELEVRGAMINGHTNGQYLDDPSLASVLGAGRGAGRDHLPPSGRSGDAVAGARRPQGAAPRHLGMDLRDRLACAAARVRRHVRPLPARDARARPHGRDAAVPALALRQPRQALRHQARQSAVATTSRRTSW